MDFGVAVTNNPRGEAKIHQPDSALTQRRQDCSPTRGWPSSERGGGVAAETRSGIAVINHWGLQQAAWGLSQTKMEDEPKSEGHNWWRCVCDAEAREGDSNGGRWFIQQGNRPVHTWTSHTRQLLLFYLSPLLVSNTFKWTNPPQMPPPPLGLPLKGEIIRLMETNVCCLSLKDPLLYQVGSFLVSCLVLLILTGTYFNKHHWESVYRCHKLRCSGWRSWFNCRTDADPYMNVSCCCWLWPCVSHSLSCLGLLCSAVLCVTVAARQVLTDEVSGAWITRPTTVGVLLPGILVGRGDNRGRW